MEKKLYDFRGKEANLLRLSRIDTFGFIHALFYRILIFVSVVYGIILMTSLFYPQLFLAAKITTIIVWVLITPQLFAAMKVLPMTSTHGAVFGKFSNAYREIISKKRIKNQILYKAFPYAVVLIWAAFFVLMLAWWHI